MPRLLPRLLKALQHPPRPLVARHDVPRIQDGSRKRTSLYRPPPDSWPSFHPGGRRHSFLLDANPVTDKQTYERHKRLPPRVRLGPRPVAHEEHDPPREMTTQEREWWSSPYLRMLATPLRQCTVSKRYLPNDFLVRLAVLRLPSTQNTRSTEVLMPDGLEHPKYKRRKARVAMYVPCWKHAVQTMKSPVALPRYSANVYVSKHLCAHIGYLLRLRVLQELDMLIGTLKRHHGRIAFDADADRTVLRRLTRAEFKALRETGTVPFSDAAAVLVVPPVNRDPGTRQRPQPSRQPVIPSGESSDPPACEKAPLPLSSLHDVRISEGVSGESADCAGEEPLLPNARVPLYNGVTMFPSAAHRAELHRLLTELLDVERRFRGTRPSSETRITGRETAGRAKGDAKGSHAFLLLSNAQTVQRADTAALAIALWRLRMWEGDAVGAATQGWEIGMGWRIEQNSRL